MFVPLVRITERWVDTEDVWTHLRHQVPFWYFGRGSRKEFHWYLGGETSVAVKSVAELCDWLRGCTYEKDELLFHESDFWQHPVTFERLRQGDCEDHAIWAWRKLKDLGIAARLFTGEWKVADEGKSGFHAWVVFEQGSKEWLLEAVSKTPEIMVLPLEEVRADYVPHFSVDHSLAIDMYCGYVQYRQRQRRRSARPVKAA
jgi:hypothetical protein